MDAVQNHDARHPGEASDPSFFGFGLYTNKSGYELWEMKQEIRFQQQAQEQMAMEAQMAMGGMTGGAGVPPIQQPPPDMPMALPNAKQEGEKPPREDETQGE